MPQVTRGLTTIEIGAIAGDGGVSTTFAAIGYTDRDSTTTLTEEDGTREELYANETNTAIDVDVTPGQTILTFSLIRPDLDTMITLWGGTKVGSGGAATWARPAAYSAIERSVKITPSKGYIITIPRMSLIPKINYDLTKSGKMVIDIVGTVLDPTKSGTLAMTFGPLVA